MYGDINNHNIFSSCKHTMHPSSLRRGHSGKRELRALPPGYIDCDLGLAIMTTQARRIAIGDNTPTPQIKSGKQNIFPLAVLSAEDGSVEGKAARLAHEIGTELLLPGTLEDEDVGAEDLAWCHLSVGIAVGAGGIDNFALISVLVLM